MKDKMRISEAEWEVMNAVWQDHPVQSAEVIKRLKGKGWNDNTVKTLLARLVRKKALTYRQERNYYLYEPLIRKEDYVRKASEQFVKRMFDGLSFPALMNFVNQTDLTQEQIRELKKILSEKEKK